jgi:outer membrane protein assembly factor BamB
MPLTRLLVKSSCLVLGLSAALVVAETKTPDWPQFRGPTGQGVSTARDVPIRWSAESNIDWKTPIPGEGWSSPVYADGRLYVTSALAGGDSDDVSLRAICVDAASGRIVWNVEALAVSAAKAGPVHQKNSRASPTPIISGGRLYVHFGHMGTAALDLEGNVLWRQTELAYPPVHGNGGSPALVDDVLVFSCDGAEKPFVAALDSATGEVRWKTPREISVQKMFSFSTPLAVSTPNGSKQIVSPGSGFVGGYDAATGREMWRVRYGQGYSVIPRPVMAHGLVFVCSGFDRPTLAAIRLTEETGDLTDTHIAWRHNRAVPHTPSLVADDDKLFFVSDNGVASCLNARSGDSHWSERLGGAFSASPILADGRVYFLSEDGVCHVVKASTTFESLAANDLGERTFASPAAIDGALFIRSESHLWRIGRSAAE